VALHLFSFFITEAFSPTIPLNIVVIIDRKEVKLKQFSNLFPYEPMKDTTFMKLLFAFKPSKTRRIK